MPTRVELLNWLESRRPLAPPALAAHVARQMRDAPMALPDQLADIGREMLAHVVDRPDGGRELALDLLTADALVTYAFEAQAELDAEGLMGLARRVGGVGA